MVSNNTSILITVHETTGAVINEGDTVTDFRGDTAVFVMATRARIPGKSGKIVVKHHMGGDGQREYYDKVFDLAVSGLLACGCPHYIVAAQGHQVGCTVQENEANDK